MSLTCGVHKDNLVIAHCDSSRSVIDSLLCIKCLPHHTHPMCHISPIGDLKSTVTHFLREARQHERALEDTCSGLRQNFKSVEDSVESATKDLQLEIDYHIMALEERKAALLQKIESIGLSKRSLLKSKSDCIEFQRKSLQQIFNFTENLEENKTNLMMTFNQLLKLFTSFPQPILPNQINFNQSISAETTMIERIRNLGVLESGPSPFMSEILGEIHKKVLLDHCTSLSVQLRDMCGINLNFSGYVQLICAKLMKPDGTMIQLPISELSTGVMEIEFVPKIEGRHELHIKINGVHIRQTPVKFEVLCVRNYQQISNDSQLFSFGKEGREDGELCRPWGICCDHKGRIIVSDRSNNRIQIFDSKGQFLQKFGKAGNGPGQFQLPAGICVNTHNQIIVADKDNHRIQIFDNDGNFVLTFGGYGSSIGMFKYPWGLTTNSHNEIAVSDSRNHRVQVFSSNGEFLLKYGLDPFNHKYLYSPRGVCYMPDGKLLITDFNQHRVFLIDKSGDYAAKYCGNKGDEEGSFSRPQGIAIDIEGHILICDSRNNRIQVFTSENMSCVSVIGKKSSFKSLLRKPNIKEPRFPSQSSPAHPEDTESRFSFNSTQTTNFSSGKAKILLNSVNNRETFGPHESLLDSPTDLCIGNQGYIYVVDFGNNCIRVF